MNLTGIFAKGNIAHIVQLILNRPVAVPLAWFGCDLPQHRPHRFAWCSRSSRFPTRRLALSPAPDTRWRHWGCADDAAANTPAIPPDVLAPTWPSLSPSVAPPSAHWRSL